MVLAAAQGEMPELLSAFALRLAIASRHVHDESMQSRGVGHAESRTA